MRIRFDTDRALLETFPSARLDIRTEPTDVDPLRFLDMLVAKGEWREALSFCAYLLPRREAVAWACRSVRALAGEGRMKGSTAFAAADLWARQPDEAHRLAAATAARTGDSNDPTTWLAQAAAWAGGHLAPQTPTPPHLTAVAARIAVILGMRLVTPPEQPGRLQACIADGARLAQAGL